MKKKEIIIAPADHPNHALAKQVEFGKKDFIKTKQGLIPLDRGGVTDKKLAAILKSKIPQEQKKTALVNYLFEQGMDNVGYLAEMQQWHGQSVKETRAFKSQMRFDFELFISIFTTFLQDTSESMWKILFPDAGEKGHGVLELEEVIMALKLIKNPEAKIDYLQTLGEENSKQVALILLATEFRNQADILTSAVKKVTQERERQAGRGIYVDKLGKTHDLLDEDLYDIIQAEKAELKKQKNNHE